MFRYLIVVAEVIALVFILRTSFVQYFLADIQQTVTHWLTEMAEYPERAELKSINEELRPQLSMMRPYQQEYLTQVLSSKAQLVTFNAHYCVQQEKNPYVSGASLSIVCSTIQNSSLVD